LGTDLCSCSGQVLAGFGPAEQILAPLAGHRCSSLQTQLLLYLCPDLIKGPHNGLAILGNPDHDSLTVTQLDEGAILPVLQHGKAEGRLYQGLIKAKGGATGSGDKLSALNWQPGSLGG
jgi:hypothetical protein